MERANTELQDLREIVIPPAPAVPLAVEGGSINSSSLRGGARSMPSTRGSSTPNIRYSRHDRFVRDIVREAYRTWNPSWEIAEVENAQIMIEDGQIRVPIRYEPLGRTKCKGVRDDFIYSLVSFFFCRHTFERMINIIIMKGGIIL